MFFGKQFVSNVLVKGNEDWNIPEEEPEMEMVFEDKALQGRFQTWQYLKHGKRKGKSY